MRAFLGICCLLFSLLACLIAIKSGWPWALAAVLSLGAFAYFAASTERRTSLE